MSSSAINQSVFSAKVSNIQNAADSSAVYSNGVWSFKNSTALTSVTITDAGNVGIGTASPAVKLQVEGSIRIPANNSLSMGNGSTYMYTDVAANGSFIFGTSSADRMRIDASGNLLVGTAVSVNNTHQLQGTTNPAGTPVLYVRKPAVSLNISGNSYVEFLASGGGFEGYIGVSGTTLQVIDASDSRKKENVRPANYGLKEIKELKPVVYDWKEEFGGEKDVKGFLAQEVKQVLPECVTIQDESERGGFSDSHFLGTANMIPVLVAAIQEQQAQIEALKAEVAALEAK